MQTKEKLLFLLEEHRGSFFSGEEIAEKLSISRTAVWKAVNALRSEGYNIEAVSRRGYRLSPDTDKLSIQGIRQWLDSKNEALLIHMVDQTESTNTLLREKANAGEAEGCVIVANRQTQGRGRRGRHFFSPPDSGVYLSLLLRPKQWLPKQAVMLTTMAAVAACEAIEAVAEQTVQIKWVNDLYINDKKVGGILTEASMSLEDETLDHIILGLGINLYLPQEGFPETLASVAGAILPDKLPNGKNRLVAAFLNGFMAYYRQDSQASLYLSAYRARSMVLGRPITVLSPQGPKPAIALDIDNECHLVVQYEDGHIETLSSGEISIQTRKG